MFKSNIKICLWSGCSGKTFLCSWSQIPPFDVVTGMGHWMTLTVRLTSVGEAQVIVAFKPQNMTHLQVRGVKEELIKFFAEGPGLACQISSLYFNIRPQWDSGTFELLYGEQYATEVLFGKRFRISPQSFFAINPRAHEKVCRTVSDLARPNLSSTLVSCRVLFSKINAECFIFESEDIYSPIAL